MFISNRTVKWAFALSFLSISFLYAAVGTPKADVALIDVAGEGGTALLAACWTWIVLSSRPAGRVTLLLAIGLASVSMGVWADCLDEFVKVPSELYFDRWLESGLVPLGMLMLTIGLFGWRREQFQLSEHMQQRERVFRDHRSFDRITQLAHADYLAEQVALEMQRHPGQEASLVMVELAGLQSLLHERGRRDSVRALQAVTHQLLLNLRPDDLLCRYAGDRLVILLPNTTLVAAQRTANHLCRMVGLMAFHTSEGERVVLSMTSACAIARADVRQSLADLGRELDLLPRRGAAFLGGAS